MSAPKHAVPLREENPDWSNVKATITCQGCGWHGEVADLLCVDKSETLWCPQCRTSGWVYD